MRKVLIAAVVAIGGAAAAAPSLEQGMLSDPVDAPAETVARAFLRGRPELVPGGDLIMERRSGGVVRFRRTFHGVPIVGGVVAVRVDARGRVRWVSSDGGVVPDALPVAPAVAAADAVRTASRGAYADAALARLVVWAPPGRAARLAWDVGLPFSMDERAAWRVIVGAADGGVLYRENRTRTAKKGKVFAAGNPVTVGLSEVTLPLPDGATMLANDDIIAENCIDRNTCPIEQAATHFRACEIESKAMADGNGDFLLDRPATDTDPEDAFAEVQMFYHSDRVLTKFRTLGLIDLNQKPMNVIVNWRQPAASAEQCNGTTSTAPLMPLENAFFTSGPQYHGFPSQAAIVFGQGAKVDYAYDGDVVYHEFTHAVQDVLYATSPGFTDQFGLDVTAGAMNEGTADYFSSSITGDPKVGEYAGGDVGFIRDIAGTKHCPEDLTGEVHDDSEPFSSGLWDARTALAEGDRPTFDQAVYNALAAFGDSESFDTARQKIVAETQVLLGGTASATVDAKMAGRGLNGCNNRVVSVALGAARGFIFLQGTNIFPMPFIAVPAPFQFSVNLTKAAQKMFLTVDKRGADSSTANLRVLIKPGSDPILWDPDLLTNDATRSIPYSVLVNKTVEIPGPFPPGPMTVQLANGSDGQVILLGLIIYTDEEGMPVASPPDAAPVVMMTGDGGGCCQVGGGAGASGAFVLVAVTLLSLRRRRR